MGIYKCECLTDIGNPVGIRSELPPVRSQNFRSGHFRLLKHELQKFLFSLNDGGLGELFHAFGGDLLSRCYFAVDMILNLFFNIFIFQ
jgi:hypothetical protein